MRAAVRGVNYVFQVEGFLGKESKLYQAILTWLYIFNIIHAGTFLSLQPLLARLFQT